MAVGAGLLMTLGLPPAAGSPDRWRLESNPNPPSTAQIYQWGGAGPDTYDCSGLTMQAWAQAGVQLLHYTGYQWEEGPHVPLDQLQRGDLLFFATNTADPSTIHHVGIYIGNGMMVDAPYTGAFVRIDGMYSAGRPYRCCPPGRLRPVWSGAGSWLSTWP